MAVYVILLVSVSIFLLGYCCKKDNAWIKLCFLAMALVGGFRYQVGIDYIGYEDIFYQTNMFAYNKCEIGYKLLLEIAYYVNGTPQLVFMMASCITCYFVYRFVELECDNKPLATVIYLCLGPLYFSSWNGVREWMAISIFLYALHYLEPDRKRYIVIICLAAMFHYSAFASFLLLCLRNVGKSYLCYLIAGCFIMHLVIKSNVISYIIQNYIPRYRNMFYWDPSMNQSYIFMFVLVVIILLLQKYYIHDAVNDKYYYLLTIMGILIFAGLYSQSLVGVFIRLISYCTPCLMIALPAVGSVVKQRWFYNISLCVMSYIYYFYIIHVGGAMLPYQGNFVLFM